MRGDPRASGGWLTLQRSEARRAECSWNGNRSVCEKCLLFCLLLVPSTGVGALGGMVSLALVWSLLGIRLSFVLWAPLLFFSPVLWSCFSVPWRRSCLSVRVFLFLFFWALVLFLFFCSLSPSFSSVPCLPLFAVPLLFFCSCSSVLLSLLLACRLVFFSTSQSTTTRLFETQILPFCAFFSFIISKKRKK